MYSTIEFGRYWSDNKPIEWFVLEETEDCYFAVSKYAILTKIFDEITDKWNESSIRNWLNKDFIDLAFDNSERASLMVVEIITTNDPYLTWGGKSSTPIVSAVNSIDKVFLLSTEEVERFFKTKQERTLEFSQYAIETLHGEMDKLGIWWLRNEEELGWGPVRILADGSYDGEFDLADEDPAMLAGIRPAIYIKKEYFERDLR